MKIIPWFRKIKTHYISIVSCQKYKNEKRQHSSNNLKTILNKKRSYRSSSFLSFKKLFEYNCAEITSSIIKLHVFMKNLKCILLSYSMKQIFLSIFLITFSKISIHAECKWRKYFIELELKPPKIFSRLVEQCKREY